MQFSPMPQLYFFEKFKPYEVHNIIIIAKIEEHLTDKDVNDLIKEHKRFIQYLSASLFNQNG